jgi:UDP-N-acetylglucosamine:LPS N-acetylglucosamine transferase
VIQRLMGLAAVRDPTLVSRFVQTRRRRLSGRAHQFGGTHTEPRVLVVSASMGAGHDGAARELARRLEHMGFSTDVRDFLESGPLRIGDALRRSYEIQLRYLPATYEATYRMWFRAPWLCPPLARFVTMLTRRKLMAWITETAPNAILSTYPLATLALGELRRSGKIAVPVVNYITDFGVHPLWIHPHVDLNLAVDDEAARSAAARSGTPSVACAPAVSDAFSPARLPTRREARLRLGIGDEDLAVLVAAGSWAVGKVEETVRTVAAGGRFLPVVACGSDSRLRTRLEAVVVGEQLRAVVIGWTDDMPGLMAACDALVENAGGLTAFEAMRAGLPVVSYKPIPGHGRENAAAMAESGVVRIAADASELPVLLEALTRAGPTRAAQVAAAAKMFGDDPAKLLAAMVQATPPDAICPGTLA